MDPTVQTLIQAWDWSYDDVDAALQGIGPKALHERPNEKTMSVAEIVAHTVYSEASIVLRFLLGVQKEDWGDHFMLRDPYGWPPTVLASTTRPGLLEMTAEEVKSAWLCQHRRFLEVMNDFDLSADHQFQDPWSDAAPNVETRLRFAAYHVAYHVGQIYSNRHHFDENTPEN